MKAGQLRGVTLPTARLIPYGDLAVGVVASFAVLMLVHSTGNGTPQRMVAGLRAAMVVLALATARVLTDPTEHTIAAAPLSRPWRHGVRVVLTLPLLALGWGSLLLYGATRISGGVPAAALSIEFASLAAIVVAAAAATGRHGAAAGPALLVFVTVTRLEQIPPWLHLYASLDDASGWQAAQRRWVIVLAAAVAVLVGSSCDTFRAPKRNRAGRRHRAERQLP